MMWQEGFAMKKLAQCRFALKPETNRMLQLFCAIFVSLYLAAVLTYGLAGIALDYQLGLLVSEHLAKGLKAGFGIACVGFLFMECK
jgi:hypothetical protein